ncbi:MAG: long-chain fatty acid--CoA ligase [Terrimicrobiaceae bacterium]
MPDRIHCENLARLYQSAAGRFGGLPAFATRHSGGDYEAVSFAQLYEKGLDLATALIHLGLQAREHVGLIADNRLEWILCDYGVLLAGAADVPRGTDVTEAEIVYILGHSDARFVIVENDSCLAKVWRARARLGGIEHIIVMAPKAPLPVPHRREAKVHSLDELLNRGRQLRSAGDRQAEERIAGVRPDDLFTIIYTSGTTGTPKGVPLTHANMASQIRNLPFSLYQGERALSILPVWHSYERVFEMVAISMGVGTYYTSIRTIGEDLKKVRPHVMASAPRLWENLYLKLLGRIQSGPAIRRGLFSMACSASLAVTRARRFFAGQELDTTGRGVVENIRLGIRRAIALIFLSVPARLLDKVVLSKVRQAAGFSDFRGTISGGGALQPHVDEFFNAIGIPVLEGYGLTETSPVLAVRTWDHLVIGTVGPMYPETEVRIVDLNTGDILFPSNRRGRGRGLRGEIHVKGPQVMGGYYKDPEATGRVLKDGWFNTGDIGMVTFNDCLKILGRSKDTIVLLNGENVEPVPIEAKLASSPLIDQCMVTGQDAKALGALIVPAMDGLKAAGCRVAYMVDAAGDARVKELIEAEIRRLVGPHTGFKPYERIVDFRLLPKPFEVGHELTNTLKLKRHVINDAYTALIAEIHKK